MSDYTDGLWVVTTPSRHVERGIPVFRRDRVDHRSVSGYRATLVRKVEGSKRDQYDHCTHHHKSPAGARKCGEAWARKLNRKETGQ